MLAATPSVLERPIGQSLKKAKMPMCLLIVHDTPLFCQGLCSFLGHQPDCCVIEETNHLQEVEEIVSREHVDIVLLDAGLHEASPAALVMRLREQGIAVLVFATEAADEEELFWFLRAGAMAYVPGFIEGEDLLEQLRRVSKGEYLITSEILEDLRQRRKRLKAIRRNWLLMHTQQFAESAAMYGQLAHRSQRSHHQRCHPLSPREQEIPEQIARGCTNLEVARVLSMSPNTVKNHLTSLLCKLGVATRTSAVVEALRQHLITADGIACPPRADRNEVQPNQTGEGELAHHIGTHQQSTLSLIDIP